MTVEVTYHSQVLKSWLPLPGQWAVGCVMTVEVTYHNQVLKSWVPLPVVE